MTVLVELSRTERYPLKSKRLSLAIKLCVGIPLALMVVSYIQAIAFPQGIVVLDKLNTETIRPNQELLIFFRLATIALLYVSWNQLPLLFPALLDHLERLQELRAPVFRYVIFVEVVINHSAYLSMLR